MNTFADRISAQRQILQLINMHEWNEPLFGLSSGAIERWQIKNKSIAKCNEILELVISAADNLLFLANKSQEQITDKYETASLSIIKIAELIKKKISSK